MIGNGGLDMSSLLRQAQKMQEDMEKKQEDLGKQEVEVTAGGGAVVVKATGTKKIVSIKIKPEILDPDDVEDVEDLLTAAINQALDKANELSEGEMNKIMPKLPEGFKLPGF